MRLTLKKETLADLTAEELSRVAAGDITTVLINSWAHCPGAETVPTLPVVYCIARTTS